jgi:glycosyltransferase involved in cell wall biosynthesis
LNIHALSGLRVGRNLVQQHSLAVIIPTYNRADALAQCLTHLENQTWKDFEVIVIDDGSTDATPDRLQSYALKTPLAFRYMRQQNGGPARARNHAISLTEAPICLMIGDDIFASPMLVEKHLRLHRQHPETSVSVLGLTRWSDTGQTVTPFMLWLDSGMQFAYGELLHGTPPCWRHFYTSNLSVKTEVLKRFPFDESFPYAAMEDMELACRIEAKHGLELVFQPEALAYHLHPTTFIQACQRMLRVGEATAHFDRMWPGIRTESGSIAKYRVKRLLQSILLNNTWAVPACIKVANWSLKVACPNYLMRYVLSCHFAIGYTRYSQNRP